MKQLLMATLLLSLPLLCSAQSKFYVKFENIQGNITSGTLLGYNSVDKIDHTFYNPTDDNIEPNGEIVYTGAKIIKAVDAITLQIQDQQSNVEPMTVLAVVKSEGKTVMKYTMQNTFVKSQRIYTTDAGELMEEIELASLEVISEHDGKQATFQNAFIRIGGR